MKTLRLINFTTTLKNNKNSILYIRQNWVHKPLINILYREGFISSFSLSENFYLKIVLRSNSTGLPLIQNLKIVSTPGKPVYLDYKKICLLNLSGKVGFFTTSKGLLTSDECKKHRVGGVLLFFI